VHGHFLSDLYVFAAVIFCHNFSVKLFNDNIPRVYCLGHLEVIFRSEIRCIKIDTVITEIMTENHNNKNIKIREKSSIHMRHTKFLFCKSYDWEFLRIKAVLPTNYKCNKIPKIFLLANLVKTLVGWNLYGIFYHNFSRIHLIGCSLWHRSKSCYMIWTFC